MARIDLKNKAIQAKLVYYGPGLCGKTTNLQYINAQMANGQELMSLSTEGDRTIFFDFMPLDLGKLRGLDVKFKLYTVPGQVRYNQTRKMVLKNVDGVVFVADSQAAMVDANLESLDNLFNNLKELGIDASVVPIVLQYNKRDLPTAMTVDELDNALNPNRYPTYLAAAATGFGVVETLKDACKRVLVHLAKSLPGRDEERTGGARTRATPSGGNRIEPALAPALAATAPAQAAAMPSEPERDRFAELGRGLSELTQELQELRRSQTARATREALTIDSALEKLCDTTASKSDVVILHQRVDALASKADLVDLTELLRSFAQSARSPASPPSAPDHDQLGSVRGELATLRTRLDQALAEAATKRDIEQLARSLSHAHSEPAAREGELERVRGELAGLRKQLSAAVSRKDVSEAIGRALEGIATQSDLAAIAAKLQADAAPPATPNTEMLDALAAMEQRFSGTLSELSQRIATLPSASDLQSLQQSIARALERLAARLDREPERAAAKAEAPSEAAALESAPAEAGAAADSPRETAPPAEAAPSETAPAEAVLPGPAPTETAESETAASESAPSEPASETAPSETAPSETAPSEKGPTEAAPSEASTETAPSESAPSEAATETAPTESAPSETTSTDAAPSEVASSEAAPTETAPADTEASQPSASASSAPAAPAAPPSDDLANDPAHQNAARVARVMVADLYLYNKEQVEEGIRSGDFAERNKEALADMRLTYESRVPPEVRTRRDHLALAIDALIEKKRKQLGL
jgi:mutual gliding-motility protein MglA